jgi:hypothetical protein
MLGKDSEQLVCFSYISPLQRVPAHSVLNERMLMEQPGRSSGKCVALSLPFWVTDVSLPLWRFQSVQSVWVLSP